MEIKGNKTCSVEQQWMVIANSHSQAAEADVLQMGCFWFDLELELYSGIRFGLEVDTF